VDPQARADPLDREVPQDLAGRADRRRDQADRQDLAGPQAVLADLRRDPADLQDPACLLAQAGRHHDRVVPQADLQADLPRDHHHDPADRHRDRHLARQADHPRVPRHDPADRHPGHHPDPHPDQQGHPAPAVRRHARDLHQVLHRARQVLQVPARHRPHLPWAHHP
jgi:hypothetical protein